MISLPGCPHCDLLNICSGAHLGKGAEIVICPSTIVLGWLIMEFLWDSSLPHIGVLIRVGLTLSCTVIFPVLGGKEIEKAGCEAK